jgi:hypothetical protein
MPLPYKAIGSTRRPVDRLTPQIPTAIEVAATVKIMKNLTEAAALIEQYAAAKAAEQRLEAVAAGANP